MRETEILRILYPHGGDSTGHSDAGPVRGRRFTQDTPILPEVWIAYATARDPSDRQDLLLTPNADSSISELVRHLRRGLAELRGEDPRRTFVAYNESHVRAQL